MVLKALQCLQSPLLNVLLALQAGPRLDLFILIAELTISLIHSAFRNFYRDKNSNQTKQKLVAEWFQPCRRVTMNLDDLRNLLSEEWPYNTAIIISFILTAWKAFDLILRTERLGNLNRILLHHTFLFLLSPGLKCHHTAHWQVICIVPVPD